MENKDKPAYSTHAGGLTKREMFAMAAMQALITQSQSSEGAKYKYTCNGGWVENVTVCQHAIELADELLKQLR